MVKDKTSLYNNHIVELNGNFFRLPTSNVNCGNFTVERSGEIIFLPYFNVTDLFSKNFNEALSCKL